MKSTLCLVSLVLALSATAQAAGPCAQLEASLRKDPSADFIRIVSAYECGPEFTKKGGKAPRPVDACVVEYESEWPNKGDVFKLMAYLDVANGLEVHHAVISEGEAFGWEYSGKTSCADIKTYVGIDLSSADRKVDASREVARDGMFCPHKTYLYYGTTCRKI